VVKYLFLGFDYEPLAFGLGLATIIYGVLFLFGGPGILEHAPSYLGFTKFQTQKFYGIVFALVGIIKIYTIWNRMWVLGPPIRSKTHVAVSFIIATLWTSLLYYFIFMNSISTEAASSLIFTIAGWWVFMRADTSNAVVRIFNRNEQKM
jgi:hypothetical protein